MRPTAVEPVEQPVVVGDITLPPGVTLDDEGTLRVHDEDGKLHNARGPAVLYLDESKEHWWHGKRVTSAEHRKLTGAT